MIQPWTATCVQVLNHTVNHANSRAEALDIIHRSLDRCEILILGGIAPGQARYVGAAETFRTGMATVVRWPVHDLSLIHI